MGVHDGVCPPSLPRGTHYGIQAWAAESDSDRTEGTGQSWHGGKAVPGKLAQCCLLQCTSHQAGRCPPPQSHCCQLTHCLHPHWCYAIGRTKERHREAKNDTMEREGEHRAFYLLPRIGSLYPGALSSGMGPPERNDTLMRNNLSKQFP